MLMATGVSRMTDVLSLLHGASLGKQDCDKAWISVLDNIHLMYTDRIVWSM